MSIYFLSRASTVKSDSSYSFQFNEMARPAGLEPAAFCLEATQQKTLVPLLVSLTRERVIYLALELTELGLKRY